MQLCTLETHLRTSRNLKNLLNSCKFTGLDQHPIHALFRTKHAAQERQEISLRVAMTLRDFCTTQ